MKTSVLLAALFVVFGAERADGQDKVDGKIKCRPNDMGGQDCDIPVSPGGRVELYYTRPIAIEAPKVDVADRFRLGIRAIPAGWVRLPGVNGQTIETINGYSFGGSLVVQLPRLMADWLGLELEFGSLGLKFFEEGGESLLAAGTFDAGLAFHVWDLDFILGYHYLVAGIQDRTLAQAHQGLLRLGWWMHQRWRIDADVLYGWTTVVRDRKDFPTNVVTREHIEGFPIELRLGLTFVAW